MLRLLAILYYSRMRSDRDEIDSIKARLSITAVAEHLGLEVRKGKIRCPYHKRHAHGDRTPSVSISEDKGLFRCWVCEDVRGDLFDLLRVVRGYSFTESLEWIRSEFPGAVASVPFATKDSNSKPFEPSSPMAKSRKQVNSSVISSELEEAPTDPLFREKIVLSFLKLLKPVDDTPAARWLARRKIFKKTWDKARLRYIDDYDRVQRDLLSQYALVDLQKAGLYNDKGHLRYYRHPLILPYLDDEFRPHYFQARTLDATLQPKELNLRGSVPFPYNKAVLNGEPGWVYLCEGAIDTLTVVEKGFMAVGIPGVRSFKTEWLGLFRNKRVVLCLDNDEAGRQGMDTLTDLFEAAGMEVARLELPEGQDINDWFGGRK